MMHQSAKPLVLLIFDGWGYRQDDQDNAINQANTPNYDRLWAQCPHTLVDASGLMVGLPKGQMGNSEVGHVNLGSGRVVYQELTRIDKAIKEGDFYDNKILTASVDQAIANDGAVHIMGLASPGGVHSHENHILAMIDLAHRRGAGRIYYHAFLDGRDMPPQSARASLEKIDQALKSTGKGYIASLCGRYFAMDRDNRWDRTEQAYHMIVEGQADYHYEDPLSALTAAYERGETDEFVKPTVICPDSVPSLKLNNGDALIYMNFRADRARSLSQAFAESSFDRFERLRHPKIDFVTLTQYSADLPVKVAYRPEKLVNTLGEYLSKQGMTQLRIAETEKYAHVTFFFNGGVETVFEGEHRILVPSPSVATYDLKPEMSAYELTDRLTDAITSQQYDVIICNYANADMVGHTGQFDAAVKAVETLDICLGKLLTAIEAADGQMLITADHGNSDLMVDPHTGAAHTAHTTNPVPLIYVGQQPLTVINDQGVLSDIAPTMLKLLGLQQPKEMTGQPIFSIKE